MRTAAIEDFGLNVVFARRDHHLCARALATEVFGQPGTHLRGVGGGKIVFVGVTPKQNAQWGEVVLCRLNHHRPMDGALRLVDGDRQTTAAPYRGHERHQQQ